MTSKTRSPKGSSQRKSSSSSGGGSGGNQRARKRFGQHWLRDDNILNQIVRAGDLLEGDRVLEIGPGRGALTQRLLDTKASVLAVEIDRDLCYQLSEQFIAYVAEGQFRLVEADFLTLNFGQALTDFELERPNKVVANIPYYITAPILEKLLGTMRAPNPTPFDSIVLLVQKEISDRLCAEPGTKANGALTIRAQYLADCEEICPVPPSAFKPAPKVESAVIRIRPRPCPTPAKDTSRLSQIVKLGFSQKRKMLRNNLQGLLPRDQMSTILEGLSLNPQVRAEGLGVPQWVALSDALGEVLTDVQNGSAPDLAPDAVANSQDSPQDSSTNSSSGGSQRGQNQSDQSDISEESAS